MNSSDPRYLGTLEEPPKGFVEVKNAPACPKGSKLWCNGKSLFSPDFRWCHVKKEVSK